MKKDENVKQDNAVTKEQIVAIAQLLFFQLVVQIGILLIIAFKGYQ